MQVLASLARAIVRGAIALATANRVIMLEHAIYSVISPEGAASILWRDTTKAQEAASGMKITAEDLERFGIVDAIVPEPSGGAHRDSAAAICTCARHKSLGSPNSRRSPQPLTTWRPNSPGAKRNCVCW